VGFELHKKEALFDPEHTLALVILQHNTPHLHMDRFVCATELKVDVDGGERCMCEGRAGKSEGEGGCADAHVFSQGCSGPGSGRPSRSPSARRAHAESPRATSSA
jgi:hypothetical protein